MAKSTKTLEESFLKLDQVIEQLEKEEITLGDSFKLYTDGMKLLKECTIPSIK